LVNATSAKKRVSIQTAVLLSLFVICGSMAVVASGLQYYFGQDIAKRAAQDLYVNVAQGVEHAMEQLDRNTSNVTRLLARSKGVFQKPALGSDHPAVPIFAEIMLASPRLYSIYIGDASGDLLQLINLESEPGLDATFATNADERWLLIHHFSAEGLRQQARTYLDKDLRLLRSEVLASSYDATRRPWYQQAIQERDLIRTKPYVFQSTGTAGATYAYRIADTEMVLGVDVTLSGLSALLASLLDETGSEAYIYSESGQAIISSLVESGGAIGSLKTFYTDSLLDETRFDRLSEHRYEGDTYYVYITPLKFALNRDQFIGISVPIKTLLAPYMSQIYVSVLVSLVLMVVLIIGAWLLAQQLIRQIEALALETRKIATRDYAGVERLFLPISQLDDLSQSLVDMSAAIKAYEHSQNALMDSIVKIIAEAIDAKSPYTAGHCERVPQIGMMLAKAASDSNDVYFKDFSFKTDDEWREFHLGAWLHDCGKITVPEHVVDKGTKLETIYNRIHEIRMRFEVLWRDAEIEMLNAQLKNASQSNRHLEELKKRQRELIEDFEFIAQSNVGGEFMSEEAEARLAKIGAQTWVRHFSDRLGLSPVEELRIANKQLPPQTLPAEEQLLADKPEHIIEREKPYVLADHLGVKMEVPEHLYNLGELYNLNVKRGTLSSEDRFKINEHIISTIRMLDEVPFTDELKNVPHFASTHHETLRGDGYPRKLAANELTMPDRILAIADIFEALTAADRPYKKAKTISESLKIMSFMVKDEHIDLELFRLFLEQGIYQKYAEAFLSPDQLDEVNINAYLLPRDAN